MTHLGFTSYIAQGGDIGSFIARQSCTEFPECIAMHLNMCIMDPPSNSSSLEISDEEKEGLERGKEFRKSGNAYVFEQATRTATIGLALSASPVALLAW